VAAFLHVCRYPGFRIQPLSASLLIVLVQLAQFLQQRCEAALKTLLGDALHLGKLTSELPQAGFNLLAPSRGAEHRDEP